MALICFEQKFWVSYCMQLHTHTLSIKKLLLYSTLLNTHFLSWFDCTLRPTADLTVLVSTPPHHYHNPFGQGISSTQLTPAPDHSVGQAWGVLFVASWFSLQCIVLLLSPFTSWNNYNENVGSSSLDIEGIWCQQTWSYQFLQTMPQNRPLTLRYV